MRLDEYNERRKEIIATKCGAVWNAFTELEGLDKQNSCNLSDNI